MSAVEIADKAVEAALGVVMDDGHNGLDCRPDRNLQVTVRAALEAALPYLPTQPVASRERVAEVLRAHQEDSVVDCICGWRDDANDEDLFGHQVLALLAAGVFSDTALCGSTTDGEAYTGVPGELSCIKAAGHKSSHVSDEGATWS